MEKSGYQRFEEMKVWNDAQAFAAEIYRLTNGIKDYGFNDQIRRAAVSISNNISEGAERTSATEFSRFLDIAKGSCGEVRSMLHLAIRLNYGLESELLSLVRDSEDISRQLSAFSKHLRRKP